VNRNVFLGLIFQYPPVLLGRVGPPFGLSPLRLPLDKSEGVVCTAFLPERLRTKKNWERQEPYDDDYRCDFHPSWQQIAWLDSETGETGEQKLVHAGGEARQFISNSRHPC
jgi:hypothetical protein